MRRFIITAGLLGAIGFAAPPAQAQEPAGCGGNRFQVDLLKDRTYIRDGETINYRVSVKNNDSSACNVSGISIQFQLPSATGNPSSTFQALTNLKAYPAGFAEQFIGPFPYTANFGPTPPARYTSRVSVGSGDLHDIPAPYSKFNIDRTLQTLTVSPALTIDKTGSTLGGAAPQTVTYTYAVRNTTLPADLLYGASDVRNVAPTDDLCAPLAYAGGDANLDGVLQPVETWTFTCTQTFNNAGVFTNTTTVCGDNVIDTIPKHVCSPPDTWTVTVTPPPPPAAPPAQGAVKPVAVAQEKCTLATPSGLKVRKGETTSIKVTVRNVDAGSVAKITLPGGKVVKAKTNAKGVATLKVKPTKTGTAKVSVAECSAIKRLTVSPARKTVSRQLPQVTG